MPTFTPDFSKKWTYPFLKYLAEKHNIPELEPILRIFKHNSYEMITNNNIIAQQIIGDQFFDIKSKLEEYFNNTTVISANLILKNKIYIKGSPKEEFNKIRGTVEIEGAWNNVEVNISGTKTSLVDNPNKTKVGKQTYSFALDHTLSSGTQENLNITVEITDPNGQLVFVPTKNIYMYDITNIDALFRFDFFINEYKIIGETVEILGVCSELFNYPTTSINKITYKLPNGQIIDEYPAANTHTKVVLTKCCAANPAKAQLTFIDGSKSEWLDSEHNKTLEVFGQYYGNLEVIGKPIARQGDTIKLKCEWHGDKCHNNYHSRRVYCESGGFTVSLSPNQTFVEISNPKFGAKYIHEVVVDNNNSKVQKLAECYIDYSYSKSYIVLFEQIRPWYSEDGVTFKYKIHGRATRLELTDGNASFDLPLNKDTYQLDSYSTSNNMQWILNMYYTDAGNIEHLINSATLNVEIINPDNRFTEALLGV